MTITRIGIVGSGQMGAGIAQVAATAGLHCFVIDSRSDQLVRGKEATQKSLARLQSKGLVSNIDEICEKIQWHTNIEHLSPCNFVVEAIVEEEGAKLELLRSLDHLVKDETIIASNTSSISITRLARAIKRPEKFIGMHFMNPVPVMQLVEIVKGHHTSEETIQSTSELAEKMNKTTTLVNDFPGFVANRVLMPMINEAFFALMENVASAKDIDTTMKLGCNMPMGPLALADLIGLDTCLSIMHVMHDGLGDPKYRPCPLLKKFVEAGMLGRKNGQGVYRYEN